MSSHPPPPPYGPPPGGHPPPPYGPPPGGQPPPPYSLPQYGQPPSPRYWPPPGGQAPVPYGPPPRKSRGVLIALLAVATLIVAGGTVGGIVLLSDGAGDGTTQRALDGTGYSYAVPEGWVDATDRVGGQDDIDSAVRAETAVDGHRATITVEVRSAGDVERPEELQNQLYLFFSGAIAGSLPARLEPAMIDGQDAIGYRATTVGRDVEMAYRSYLTINDGRMVLIMLSTSEKGEAEASQALVRLFESWSWRATGRGNV